MAGDSRNVFLHCLVPCHSIEMNFQNCSYECNISYADIVCSILHQFFYSRKMV